VNKEGLSLANIKMPKIGLGGAMYEKLSLYESIELSLQAYKDGIKYFDGHAEYGKSEMGLGEIKKLHPEIIISTKTRGYRDIHVIHDQLSRSLYCLDKIPIYIFSNVDTESEYQKLIHLLPFFDGFKATNRIGVFGISSHYPDFILRSLNDNLAIDVFMFPYNIIRKDCEKLLPLLKERNKGTIIIKPFSAGEVWNRFSPKDMLQFYADKQDQFTSLLFGVHSLSELSEDLRLIKEIWGGI